MAYRLSDYEKDEKSNNISSSSSNGYRLSDWEKDNRANLSQGSRDQAFGKVAPTVTSLPTNTMKSISNNNVVANVAAPTVTAPKTLRETVQPLSFSAPTLERSRSTTVSTPEIERKNYVDDKVSKDDALLGNSKLRNLILPLSKAIYTAESYLAPLQQGAGNALGIKATTAPYERTTLNKGLEIAGSVLGSVTNPSNIGQGLVSMPFKVGQQVAQKAAQVAPKLGNNIVQRGIEGAVAGGIQGGVISGVRGETDLKELATNVGLGVGLGAVGDVAIAGIGSGIRGIRNAKNTKAATEVNNVTPSTVDNGMPSVETIQTPTTRTPNVNSSTANNIPNERKFVKTLRESGKLTDDVNASINSSPVRKYENITNTDTLDIANKRIAESGIDKAESDLLNKKKLKADDLATGMRLVQELQNSGNVERAVTIAERLAKELTEAGQTVQAASIWNRLSPEGALLAAQRKVNNINDKLLLGQKEVKITKETATDITEAAQTIQAAGVSSERAGNVMTILDKLRKGDNITDAEKLEISDFVKDANRFVKPEKVKLPTKTKQPKEMNDVRVKDRVISFLEEQELAAKERLRKKGVRVSSNPLDIWADYAYIGALKMAKGVVNFSDWSTQMIKDAGEQIKPNLSAIYEKSKETLTSTSKNINEQVISQAEKVTEGYIKNNIKLNDADITMLRGVAQKVSSLSGESKRIASQDLQAILQDFEKVGVGRKLSSAQYISMLLNPITQMRNIVGNELMYRTERLSKLIATPIDAVTSKLSGKERTVTFKNGKSVWEDYFKPSQDYWGSLKEGASSGWRGVSPEGLTSKYDIQGQAFKSKYNPLTYMEKALGATLQGFDYASYTRATNQTMREMAYLDAINKGLKNSDEIRNYTQTYMANIDDVTHEIASDYGKFVTLQNDSLLSGKIMGFRRGLNQVSTAGLSKEFGAGSIFIPFAKTPANLLLRGMDYSPIGALKSIKEMSEILIDPKTDLTRADVISSISRSIVGTGFGAVGYWLAEKGALFGKSDKDAEVRKLMNASGLKDFQINGSALMRMVQSGFNKDDIDKAAKLQAGDTLWSYEWAQPISMPFAIGSNIQKSKSEGKGLAATAGDATLDGVSTLLDSSVLSSLKEIFQTNMGEDNAFKSIAFNMIKQVPSQFVPSFMRQLNTVYDDTVKETYAPKGDTAGAIFNSSKANIPFLSQQMPQRVDTLGNPQTKLNTFLDVFISPAARSKYKPTPEANLVIDLMNETGDKTLAPRAVNKYISGTSIATGKKERKELTPEQYVYYQNLVGDMTTEGLKKIGSNLSTEKKVEKVLDVLNKSGKEAKKIMNKELGFK